MIRSFVHKGLERFFRTGSTSGIQAKHANRLRLMLAQLDRAATVQDMVFPARACTNSRATAKACGL